MKKLLAYSVLYFGFIAVEGVNPLKPDEQAYQDFEQLVTEFSMKNCSLNTRIFNVLELYYQQELGLNCSVPQQVCHECQPCSECICPYCPSDQVIPYYISNNLILSASNTTEYLFFVYKVERLIWGH